MKGKIWKNRYERWIPKELAEDWTQILNLILNNYRKITWTEEDKHGNKKLRRQTHAHAMLTIQILKYKHERENSKAFAAQRTFAKTMKCSERTIRRLMLNLKKVGLKIDRPNRNTTNRYTVGELIDRYLEAAGFPVEEADKIPPDPDENQGW